MSSPHTHKTRRCASRASGPPAALLEIGICLKPTPCPPRQHLPGPPPDPFSRSMPLLSSLSNTATQAPRHRQTKSDQAKHRISRPNRKQNTQYIKNAGRTQKHAGYQQSRPNTITSGHQERKPKINHLGHRTSTASASLASTNSMVPSSWANLAPGASPVRLASWSRSYAMRLSPGASAAARW
jgi:hypothetical protein